jgi:hypothetical protein
MNTTTLVAVPEGGTTLDVLAMRYRAAFGRVQGGREQWIDGTLELAVVVAEVRGRMPDHREYNRWTTHYQLEQLHPAELAALAGIGNLEREKPHAGRKLLEKNSGLAIRTIWEKKREKPVVDPSEKGKGPLSHNSGASKRKRRNVIPDVMREDHVPGTRSRPEPPPSRQRRQRSTPDIPQEPRPERKAVILKGLTREQVDPDFVGTPLEFATKYGHVNLQTKQQIEHHKGQEELMAWLGLVSDLDRAARALLAATATDSETLREWMSKPAKAEKLRTWFSNIERACESLRGLSIHK